MAKKTKGNTILFIEDEKDIRAFACKVLELEGYKCRQAKTADEALYLLTKEKIDLIILDLKLHDSDGWEVLQKLKTTPETAAIPVIICTASPIQHLKERALKIGAIDYLVEPLSANVLREAISRVLPIEI